MSDPGFKKLFSHPTMIEQVIRRHVPRWADRLDYATLRKAPTELISDKLVRRYADLVWQCARSDGAGHLLLLIEFQGAPDPRMALRTTVYSALAADEMLARQATQDQPGSDLSVAALVLYHGDRPWNAPTHAAGLLVESELDAYDLILPRRALETDDPGLLDLPAMALRLGSERTGEGMKSALLLILRLARQRGDPEFERHMVRGTAEMLVSMGMPEQLLKEAVTMETMVPAFERWLNDMAQRERDRGHAQLLGRMVARKFGSAAAGELAEELAGPITPDRLRLLSDAVLECGSAEEFLARAR